MKIIQLFRKFKLLEAGPINDVIELERLFLNFSVGDFFDSLLESNFKQINCLAEKKALNIFHRAAELVPAYRDFLKKAKIDHLKINSINDFKYVPLTDKENYLRYYPQNKLFWCGKLEGTTMISVSSGSTGKPYYWPRSIHLEYETALMHEIFTNVFFKIKKKKSLVIDGYSMGMYVAGTFTLNSFRKIAKKMYPLTIVSPGIDYREILQVVKDLGRKFDQIILTGYPPFIKDIIDYGIQERIKWSDFNLRFIFGAENFSEEWRNHILGLIGVVKEDQIIISSMNTYGSADCAILGHETPLSIKIRRLINNQGLIVKVFDQNYLPTLVQYNPVLRYFESVNDELIFTAQGGLPLIRYNIKDRGKILDYNTLIQRINHNNRLKIPEEYIVWTRLPFLYLFGRSDNTVTLYGLNIYPENIKSALEDKKIINLVSGKFKLYTKNYKDFSQYLEIQVELKHKTTHSSYKLIIKKLIIEYLKKLNFEYSKLYEKIGKRAEPKVVLVPPGTFLLNRCKHKWATN